MQTSRTWLLVMQIMHEGPRPVWDRYRSWNLWTNSAARWITLRCDWPPAAGVESTVGLSSTFLPYSSLTSIHSYLSTLPPPSRVLFCMRTRSPPPLRAESSVELRKQTRWRRPPRDGGLRTRLLFLLIVGPVSEFLWSVCAWRDPVTSRF